MTAGLCLLMASWSSGGSDETALVVTTGDGSGARSRRFVIVNGEGVPDYDYGDDYDPGHDAGGGGGHDFGPGHDTGGGGGHDYDDWYPDIDLDDDHHHHHDDDDFDFGHYGPDYHHHVWWHYFYHHDEPHLPFPLFPPFFVHRLRPVYRRLRRGCDEWPFVCKNAYEVVQWLQCYHEFLGGSLRVDKFHRGVPVVPVHAWKKK